VSVGVGVHRALQAAEELAADGDGVSATVLDLRTVAPLDVAAVCREVGRTGRLVVVDEDYEAFGLSGELAAVVMEAGIPCRMTRVCTRATIPYARALEDEALPNVARIRTAVREVLQPARRDT
jgi:pyruvate dehydrogenase E1 component beta subunit